MWLRKYHLSKAFWQFIIGKALGNRAFVNTEYVSTLRIGHDENFDGVGIRALTLWTRAASAFTNGARQRPDDP